MKKTKVTTESTTQYVVYYGAAAIKDRNKETFIEEKDAEEFYNNKERENFHVSCEKVVVETTTTRQLLGGKSPF